LNENGIPEQNELVANLQKQITTLSAEIKALSSGKEKAESENEQLKAEAELSRKVILELATRTAQLDGVDIPTIERQAADEILALREQLAAVQSENQVQMNALKSNYASAVIQQEKTMNGLQGKYLDAVASEIVKMSQKSERLQAEIDQSRPEIQTLRQQVATFQQGSAELAQELRAVMTELEKQNETAAQMVENVRAADSKARQDELASIPVATPVEPSRTDRFLASAKAALEKLKTKK
jgi:chromosome segregation ATPase